MTLDVRGLVVGYPGQATPTLHRVDLELRSGFAWIVGRNAAGKTTLLKALSGQLPARSGSMVLDGEPLSATNARGVVTFVPDEDVLPLFLTAREVVHLATRFAGRSPSAGDVDALFDLFEFDPGLGSSLVGALSFGSRRKLRLLVELIDARRVVLLDEPFIGLDPVAVDSLLGVLEALATRRRLIIISSHRQDLARLLGGLTLGIDAGVVSADLGVASIDPGGGGPAGAASEPRWGARRERALELLVP